MLNKAKLYTVSVQFIHLLADSKGKITPLLQRKWSLLDFLRENFKILSIEYLVRFVFPLVLCGKHLLQIYSKDYQPDISSFRRIPRLYANTQIATAFL